MNLEQWIAVLTPIVSGASGILFALTVFVNRIKNLRSEVKAQVQDNAKIAAELANTRKALTDLSLKVNFVVEEVKKNVKQK